MELLEQSQGRAMKRAGAPPRQGQAEAALGCSAWRGEGSKETLEQPISSRLGAKKSWGGTFYRGTLQQGEGL